MVLVNGCKEFVIFVIYLIEKVWVLKVYIEKIFDGLFGKGVLICFYMIKVLDYKYEYN